MEKIDKLNDLLFKQIEKISGIKDPNALVEEIDRSKAMAMMASQYISAEALKIKQAIVVNNRNEKNRYLTE